MTVEQNSEYKVSLVGGAVIISKIGGSQSKPSASFSSVYRLISVIDNKCSSNKTEKNKNIMAVLKVQLIYCIDF